MTDTTKLTAQERKALEQVLKRREREANESAGEVKAQRLAAFEEELAHEFSAEDAAFKDVTTFANELVAKANAEIDRRCDELGIRRAFRPKLRLGWSPRGENTDNERRAELRKVAERRAEADKLAAQKQIRRTFTDQLELLATGLLDSEEARTFLDRMPRPEALMPEVRLAELDLGDKTIRAAWRVPLPLLAVNPAGAEDPSQVDEDNEW